MLTFGEKIEQGYFPIIFQSALPKLQRSITRVDQVNRILVCIVHAATILHDERFSLTRTILSLALDPLALVWSWQFRILVLTLSPVVVPALQVLPLVWFL